MGRGVMRRGGMELRANRRGTGEGIVFFLLWVFVPAWWRRAKRILMAPSRRKVRLAVVAKSYVSNRCLLPFGIRPSSIPTGCYEKNQTATLLYQRH